MEVLSEAQVADLLGVPRGLHGLDGAMLVTMLLHTRRHLADLLTLFGVPAADSERLASELCAREVATTPLSLEDQMTRMDVLIDMVQVSLNRIDEAKRALDCTAELWEYCGLCGDAVPRLATIYHANGVVCQGVCAACMPMLAACPRCSGAILDWA